jgi:N-hydroxyarylamine O-acetyltransferase
MDRQLYLERIQCAGPVSPNLETLQRLHRQHLLHVPFENLDIHLGRPLSLDVSDLFDKIVRRRRGGFCYELNTLFAALLEELGYRVDRLSARVRGDDGQLGPEFDHMVLLVHLDSRWLVDVGFGNSFVDPVNLDQEETHVESDVEYRLRSEDDVLALQQRTPPRDWATQYTFNTIPRDTSEFVPMCRFHETSPQSPFPQKRVCTKATPWGRITLSDLRWIETASSHRDERALNSEAEFEEILRDRFGIDLTA